jgi:predicted transcriptional regulator
MFNKKTGARPAMTTKAYDLRVKQMEILARMMMINLRALFALYKRARGTNIGAVFPELICLTAIRARKMKPVSVRVISQSTGLPLPTVRRSLARLVRHGAIVKIGRRGYSNDDDFTATAADAREIRHVLRAVAAAADKLHALK